MKLRMTKLNAALCLILAQTAAYAGAGQLFNVSATGTPGTLSITLCLNAAAQLSCQVYNVSALTLSITAALNHLYPNAGIKINTPGYTPTGCTILSNGFCSFTVSKTAAVSIPVKATNVYIKAGGTCGTGTGSMDNPYTCLSDAESNPNWINLNVMSSSGILDGGITLLNGQNIVGLCSDIANRKIQNSTGATHNGDAIVTTGNNSITGITIPTSYRAGVNGAASTNLTIDCMTITNTNTSGQQTTNPKGSFSYASIDMGYTTNSGATSISNINISDAYYGIFLSSSGSATRTYLVTNANIHDISSLGGTTGDAVGVMAQDTSSQSGTIKNSVLTDVGLPGGPGNGIVIYAFDSGRLPNTTISDNTISSFPVVAVGVWYETARSTNYPSNVDPEVITIDSNNLGNNRFPIYMGSNVNDFRFTLNIENNNIVSNPSNKSLYPFNYTFYPSSSGNNVATFNINNNAIANADGAAIQVTSQSASTPPDLTYTLDNNKIKNAGVSFLIATSGGATSWTSMILNGTGNCFEANGESSGVYGFDLGQIFVGAQNLAGPTANTVVNFHQNYIINPVLGNVGTGPFDVLFAGGTADLSQNYWADGCPTCVPRDFINAPIVSVPVTGAGTYLTTGPTSCNVPDYVPFALHSAKLKLPSHASKAKSRTPAAVIDKRWMSVSLQDRADYMKDLIKHSHGSQ